MEPLRKYLGRGMNLENIKNEKALAALGFASRYLPDPPDIFDEFEFTANLGGISNLGLMVTVESMHIKRMFFGVISNDDPDVITGVDESQLERIFSQSGAELSAFLDFITK